MASGYTSGGGLAPRAPAVEDHDVRLFGDGLAAGADLARALDAAIAQALGPLGGERPDLLAVFVAGVDPDELDDLLPAAVAASRARHSIGCTAAGVSASRRASEGGPAVSAWAAVVPGMSLRSFHLEVMRVDAGMAVVGLPDRRDDECVAILLADAFSFPTDSFLARTASAMPGLDLVGGLAAGRDGPGSTRLLVDGRLVDRGAVGVLLGGTSVTEVVRPVVSQGCRPLGADMTVTRVEGNRLLEMAGAPAAERLRLVLDELDDDEQERYRRHPMIGLALDEYAEERGQGDFLVRPVLGLDVDRPGLPVGEPVAVGRTVRFHTVDAESAGADLRAALHGAGRASGALVFSGAGRGSALFGHADHDVTTVAELTGASAVAGAFTGGELGPAHGRSWMHGFAASALLFR